jgi:hypothetical protein
MMVEWGKAWPDAMRSPCARQQAEKDCPTPVLLNVGQYGSVKSRGLSAYFAGAFFGGFSVPGVGAGGMS